MVMGTCDFQILIMARFTENKQRNGQTDDHGCTQRPSVFPYIAHFDFHAVCGQVIRNQFLEDPTEPEGQGDIRCFQTEGQRAGCTASIQIHFIHQRQQSRDQDRNERDMNRNQILRAAGNQGQYH